MSEGEIKLIREGDTVILTFPRPTSELCFDADSAMGFASSIAQVALDIKNGVSGKKH